MKLAIFMMIAVFAATTFGQTSVFTYQGRLTEGGLPAGGTYQMQFTVYDAVSGGAIVGPTITLSSVTVTNGVFSVDLDYSPVLPFATGANRYVNIAVKKPADATYTTLLPRQQVTSSPYAIKSATATTSDLLAASCVGCVDDAKIAGISGSKVSGAVPAAATVTGIVPVANGGTGSATQNFVDLSTTQTIIGAKAFSTPPTGVVSIVPFNGFTSLGIAASSASYVFVGPTVNINVASGRRITGTATAALGKVAGTAQAADVGLCYQLGAGVVTNFVGNNYITHTIPAGRTNITAVGSITGLAAGTYVLGYCVKNSGTDILNNNDYLNGWIMVTAP